MTDSMFGYKGWWRPKPLTRWEIEQMKKTMKKVPIIKAKSDEYHKKEEKQADDEFEKKLNSL